MLPGTWTSPWLSWGRTEVRQACLLGLSVQEPSCFKGWHLTVWQLARKDNFNKSQFTFATAVLTFVESYSVVLRWYCALVWYMISGTQLFNFAVCADWHMNSCLFFHQSTEFNHSINSLQTPQRSWIVRSILWETHLQVNFRVLC